MQESLQKYSMSARWKILKGDSCFQEYGSLVGENQAIYRSKNNK